MRQDHDKRRAEDGGAIFDGAERSDINEIASVAGDEQFADAVPAEDKLGRYPAVGAGDNRRPRRLMPGDVAAGLSKVDGAEFWMAHEALIARFELNERFLGGKRSRPIILFYRMLLWCLAFYFD